MAENKIETMGGDKNNKSGARITGASIATKNLQIASPKEMGIGKLLGLLRARRVEVDTIVSAVEIIAEKTNDGTGFGDMTLLEAIDKNPAAIRTLHYHATGGELILKDAMDSALETAARFGLFEYNEKAALIESILSKARMLDQIKGSPC